MSCQHLKIIGTCDVCKRDDEIAALQIEVKELKRAIRILSEQKVQYMNGQKEDGTPIKLFNVDTQWLQSFLNQDT